MLVRAPRKRELAGEPQVGQPALKKSRQVERRFKKRKLQEVLDELCIRVESNDRQLTNNLIRELDTEHVRVISNEDFEASCTQILKACLTAKIESVSSKMFACLMSMFARGSQQSRKDFVNSLQNYCEGLAKATREAAKSNAVVAEAQGSSTSGTMSSDSSISSKRKPPSKKSSSTTLSKSSSTGCSRSGSSGPSESGSCRSEHDSSDSEIGCDSKKLMEKRKKIRKSSKDQATNARKFKKSSLKILDSVMEDEDEEITVIDGFFLKPNLDCGILGIYTTVLKEGLIKVHEVPEKVKLCARRSLAQTSLSTTANRIAALEFHVAIAIATTTLTPEQVGNVVRFGGEHGDEDIVKEQPKTELVECEIFLTHLAADRDFRVRKSVAGGLLELSKIYNLSRSTYSIAKSFMKDADPDIRIAAIRLLIHYALKMGSENFDEGKSTTTISDDAFSEICDAINDIEIAVRVEAAKKLGDFDTVSDDLIFQTLDKKMMKTNKNKQVVKVEQSLFALSKKASVQRDRRWKAFRQAPKVEEKSRGGWSRGKELNAVCPGEDEKEEADGGESIIPHGACGAFVSALEDEFMDVRKAAVYSLGLLACNRPAFAVSALEYLADMFNDEIADVRLDAINALTPLISHGQLNAEQLNVISKCLDDAMPESRQAMRELLKRAQFTDVNCVEMCVKALLACLRRFPKDKEQIYSCMAEIGKNHSVQVQSIMRSLLGIHLIFHTRETSIEDQEYVGKLIMVLNAASSQPSLVHFMPEFVHRHYRLLRNSYPKIVKAIRVLDEVKSIGKEKDADLNSNEKAEDVVLDTYRRLCNVASTALHYDRNIKRDDIFRDTSAISLYNSSVSGAARLIFCLGEVSSTVDSVSNTVLRGGELTNVKQLISQSIEDMQSVEHQFSGISVQIHSYLIYCRVYLLFLDMLVWMMQVMAPQQDVIAAGQSIVRETRIAMENCRDIPDALLSFISTLESVFFPPIQIPVYVHSIEEKRKIITPNTLIELLCRSTPVLPSKFPPVASVHLKYARITSPNKDTAVEECLKFFAYLPHGMPLEFDIYNMRADELECVRIKTIHPDGRFDVMRPRIEEFRLEDGHYSVATQVKITSSSPWSSPAEIDVVIGILSNHKFVPLFASPSCFSPAHIRVRIHPHSR